MRFEANVPVEVALQYADGKPVVSSKTQQDEVMFTLTTGQRMYLDPYVARKIEQLGVLPREAFTICKVVEGRGAARRVQWSVARKDPPSLAARATAGKVASAESARGVDDDGPPIEWEYGLAPARIEQAIMQGGLPPIGETAPAIDEFRQRVIATLRETLRAMESGAL